MSTTTFNTTAYSGTEIKAFIKVILKRKNAAPSDTPDSIFLHLGTIKSITISSQTQIKPRMVLGRDKTAGVSTGVTSITGQVSFQVFNKSIFENLKDQIQSYYKTNNVPEDDYSVVFQNGQEIPITKAVDFDVLPPFDILLLAVKENDASKRMKKVIKNVVLASNGSGIGLSTLAVEEGYEFIAQKIESFKDASFYPTP